MKTMIATATLAALAGASLTALAGTYEAWGHTFSYDEFRPMTLDVTVATEKSTGHKMNLIRLKNGHMMAVVPADRYMALMLSPPNPDDMLQ